MFLIAHCSSKMGLIQLPYANYTFIGKMVVLMMFISNWSDDVTIRPTWGIRVKIFSFILCRSGKCQNRKHQRREKKHLAHIFLEFSGVATFWILNLWHFLLSIDQTWNPLQMQIHQSLVYNFFVILLKNILRKYSLNFFHPNFLLLLVPTLIQIFKKNGGNKD